MLRRATFQQKEERELSPGAGKNLATQGTVKSPGQAESTGASVGRCDRRRGHELVIRALWAQWKCLHLELW